MKIILYISVEELTYILSYILLSYILLLFIFQKRIQICMYSTVHITQTLLLYFL